MFTRMQLKYINKKLNTVGVKYAEKIVSISKAKQRKVKCAGEKQLGEMKAVAETINRRSIGMRLTSPCLCRSVLCCKRLIRKHYDVELKIGAKSYTENTNAEMRIFRSFYWFRKTWSDLYSSLTKKKNKFSDKIELQQGLVNTIFTCLPVASILIYLMMPSLSGENVAADTINIFNSCTVMTTSAVMLSYSFDSLSGMLINYENYFRLFAVESPKARNEGVMSSSSSVELGHVSFRYNEEESTREAVQDVSVKFESGKVYALVGCNGSGKTTLAKLIMKLYRPSKGTVEMLDGNGKETDLRTSTVMQDFMRYDVSLKENITFGDFEKEQDAERYQKAIQNSESGSLVKKIGEDTILGTRFGKVNLSGGEWQRIAVARGFFRRESAVVVFDEPNSSIDAIAESKIIKNMIAENRDKICIFITHRLASVKFADQILVMKDGKLIEQGTHHQLIEGDTEYNRMFSAQVEWYQ